MVKKTDDSLVLKVLDLKMFRSGKMNSSVGVRVLSGVLSFSKSLRVSSCHGEENCWFFGFESFGL